MCVNSHALNRGLIPARAGNTSVSFIPLVDGRAHPRSRGEHSTPCSPCRLKPGSSPLARGTLVYQVTEDGRLGLIPARAGNTRPAGLKVEGDRAHPRSRGEHRSVPGTGLMTMGSSPLARGTHLLTWDFTPYISKIESLWSQSLTPEYTISSNY